MYKMLYHDMSKVMCIIYFFLSILVYSITHLCLNDLCAFN